jgi:hypothetical protein
VCQTVCPFNRFVVETRESAFRAADLDRAAPPLVDLLALDEAGFRQRFAGTPIQRIGRARWCATPAWQPVTDAALRRSLCWNGWRAGRVGAGARARCVGVRSILNVECLILN